MPLPLSTVVPIVLTAKMNENVSPEKGRGRGSHRQLSHWGNTWRQKLAGCKWPDVRRELETNPEPSGAQRPPWTSSTPEPYRLAAELQIMRHGNHG